MGLELRPRRLRDAVNLFAALEAAGGAGLRDSAWSHPDLAPSADDLDDPLGPEMAGWLGLEDEPSVWFSFVLSMALLALIMRKG